MSMKLRIPIREPQNKTQDTEHQNPYHKHPAIDQVRIDKARRKSELKKGQPVPAFPIHPDNQPTPTPQQRKSKVIHGTELRHHNPCQKQPHFCIRLNPWHNPPFHEIISGSPVNEAIHIGFRDGSSGWRKQETNSRGNPSIKLRFQLKDLYCQRLVLIADEGMDTVEIPRN